MAPLARKDRDPAPKRRKGGASARVNRNQNGQAMGAKGLNTRRRLVDATARLLETRALRDLKVAEIAREAGASPATFYLYFGDVTDAVLAVIAELSQSTPEVLALLEGPWPTQGALERSQSLVEAYVRYWDAHRAVFRVRNLASDEGDERFTAARLRAVAPILAALVARIEEAQRAGGAGAGLRPQALAGAIVAMLERVAAVTRPRSYTYADPELLEAAAFMIAATLKGVADPPTGKRA